MKEKMEKDVKTTKENKRLMLTTAILVLIVAIVYFVGIIVGGAFREFCQAAILWVLMGIGIACYGTYVSQKE